MSLKSLRICIYIYIVMFIHIYICDINGIFSIAMFVYQRVIGKRMEKQTRYSNLGQADDLNDHDSRLVFQRQEKTTIFTISYSRPKNILSRLETIHRITFNCVVFSS